jgi:hypothetical protein
MTPVDPEELGRFRALLGGVTERIAGRDLDSELENWLNEQHGPARPSYRAIREACLAGVKSGWLCTRGDWPLRYGRVIKPSDDLQRFSVDVVDMENVVGPHHVHPAGEIDLVMPLEDNARFDGRGAGFVVYGPGSSHSPAVSGGRALVLYLLPKGRIEFTGA